MVGHSVSPGCEVGGEGLPQLSSWSGWHGQGYVLGGGVGRCQDWGAGWGCTPFGVGLGYGVGSGGTRTVGLDRGLRMGGCLCPMEPGVLGHV